MLLFVNRRWR